MLRKNATEQESSSSVAGLGGGSDGGTSGGGNGTGNGFVDYVLDPIKAGLKGVGVYLGVNNFVNNFKDHTKFLAGKQWAKFGQPYDAFKTFQAEGGLLAKPGPAGQIIGKGGKLLSAFGRFAGPLLAPIGIIGGIHDIFNPSHEGTRGVLDRVAGGLGVVGGVGSILIAAGLVANPVGVAVLIGAGVAAGAWALGNMVADSAWGKAAGKWVGDKASKAWNTVSSTVGSVAESATDAVGNAVTGAKNFLSNRVKSLGGLFA